MSTFMSAFAHLVERFADLLQPLFHASSAAAAIVLFTALVRLLVHPLSRAAARGQRARAALQPQIAQLRKKHGKDPEKLQKALMELHAAEKVSPLSGCLPSLLQMPAFFLLYHLFSSSTIGGEANALLGHTLSDAPLGGRWADALGDGGLFGPAGLVYLALFAVVAAVATFNYSRTKRMTASAPVVGDGEQVPGLASVTKLMPFMSFFTLFTVAVVPLAAALYVVTSTTWSAVERAVLYRDMPGAAPATAALV
ncbi:MULTISPECIES: membrane protein insertase YidC [unclassified Streptomyces]|uniref:YidC/Oxa1 family membrane protein insertase n=1 Tax=unclassified Streptomyces TaxID=2593676 RepID=UPI0022593722|nr:MULTISPECIES: membrane protein insertase YidC [unclassified Streptomyces]MCX4990675.1 YidC/Oxa1 family membrane protein insertase [Streptomyces sp. NBC_00568]MCX5004094.1 YidC/Oxa1 family membrane protein insertase [Streptomyces sp. NBC_00638]